jgi:hypothetical protein
MPRERIRTAEAAFNSATKAARRRASQDQQWLKRPAGEVAGDVQKSIDAATVACYPLERSAPVANADLSASYPALPHPQGLVTPFQREKYDRRIPMRGSPTESLS